MKFITKKKIQSKDKTKEFFIVWLLSDTNDILQIFSNQKVFDTLNYKIGDLVPDNKISSSSYVNNKGQMITRFELV